MSKGDRHEGDRVSYLLHRSRLSKTAHNVIVVKAALTVAFLLIVFLPAGYAAWAGVAANFLWLWRT